MSLCAVLSGAGSWVEVALYGKRKLAFLRRFLPFAEGTPSHDQLGNIYAALDDEQFQECFIAWAGALKSHVKGVVAVDGKTLRRSFDKGGGKGPIHMVSAWSSGQRLVLGQRQVDKKSNEITAIPAICPSPKPKASCCSTSSAGSTGAPRSSSLPIWPSAIGRPSSATPR